MTVSRKLKTKPAFLLGSPTPGAVKRLPKPDTIRLTVGYAILPKSFKHSLGVSLRKVAQQGDVAAFAVQVPIPVGDFKTARVKRLMREAETAIGLPSKD